MKRCLTLSVILLLSGTLFAGESEEYLNTIDKEEVKKEIEKDPDKGLNKLKSHISAYKTRKSKEIKDEVRDTPEFTWALDTVISTLAENEDTLRQKQPKMASRGREKSEIQETIEKYRKVLAKSKDPEYNQSMKHTLKTLEKKLEGEKEYKTLLRKYSTPEGASKVNQRAIPALNVLAEMGPSAKDAGPVVVGQLRSSSDPKVRESACRTLGRMKNPKAAPALVEVLEKGDEEPMVKMRACIALARIGPDAADKKVLKAVEKMLRLTEKEHQKNFLARQQRVLDKKLIRMQSMAGIFTKEEKDEFIKMEWTNKKDHFKKVFDEEYRIELSAACTALWGLGEKSKVYVDDVIPILKGYRGHFATKIAAARALWAMGPSVADKTVPALGEELLNKDNMSPPEGMKDNSRGYYGVGLRMNLAEQIAGIGDPRGIPYLEKAASTDPDGDVRGLCAKLAKELKAGKEYTPVTTPDSFGQ